MSRSCVTEANRTQFRVEGYTVLSGVFGDQLDALCAASENIPNAPNAFHTFEKIEGTGEIVPSRTEGFLWCGDQETTPLAPFLGNGGMLAEAISALAGEGPVALYKEKLNYKLAGGGGYTAHQDGYSAFGNAEPYSFMTQVCMIALDDMTKANGCPELAPEKWKKKEGWLSKKDGVSVGYPPEDELGPWVPVELKRGDVLVYDNCACTPACHLQCLPHLETENKARLTLRCLVDMLHRSGANHTHTNRRALFGIYNAASDGDYHDRYYQNEAKGRRAQGTKKIGGKANQFFTGTGVVAEAAAAVSETRPIATQADKENVWAELMAMFNDGDSGEGGQAHGLQTAYQAELAGMDAATITAGLLHDIGWKLARPPQGGSQFEGSADSIAAIEGILSFCGDQLGPGAEGDEISAEQQRAQHDVIGSTWLQMRGFEYKVAHIVEGHVLAKRYLTGTDKSYNDQLSSGSQRTLRFQGGPMTAEEARIFETDSLFEENVQMRKWDEGAKVEGKIVPPFEHYKDAVMESIAYAPCDVTQFAEVGGLAYKRNGNVILEPAFAKASL